MDNPTFKVIEILPLQQGTNERGVWQSQDVVLEVIDNVPYPDRFVVTFRGEKVKMLEGINIGDRVSACWSANVREWTTRDGRKAYSQQLNGWKCSVNS